MLQYTNIAYTYTYSGHIPAADVARELLTTSRYWEKFTTACTGPLDATAPTTISGCFIRNHADSAPGYQCMGKKEVSRPVCMLSFAYSIPVISAHESAKVQVYGFGLFHHMVLPIGLMINLESMIEC